MLSNFYSNLPAEIESSIDVLAKRLPIGEGHLGGIPCAPSKDLEQQKTTFI